MRKIFCLLFAFILWLPSQIIYAKEPERFIFVSVEYSDNPGGQEILELMVEGNIYVDAVALAERLGYHTENTEDYILIYNMDNSEIPIGKTKFFYDSTKVEHMIFDKMIDSYEAPFPSLNNDRGSWIPLEYSLLILNSGMIILEDSLLIDIPCKNIMDCCYDLLGNMEHYNFAWMKDFGYLWQKKQTIESFDYTLKLDGSVWPHLFQAASLNSLKYEEDYAKVLAALLCCESAGEFSLSMEKVGSGQESFLEFGQTGRILEGYLVTADSDLDSLYANYKELLEKIKEENSPTVSYSRAYKALELAADREIWFSDIGSKSIEVHKELGGKASVRDIGVDVKRAAEYRDEFTGQDEFSFSAVMNYLNSAVDYTSLRKNMPRLKDESVDDILRYSEKYSMANFLLGNMEKWYLDLLPDLKAIEKRAMLNVFIRDAILSMLSAMPDKKETIDKFEMLLYSQEFQENAFINCRKLVGEACESPETFLAEDWYVLSQYCYTYLKSCYIARCIGMALFENDLRKEKRDWAVDWQNNINYEVSKAMINFKTANKTNKGNVYGFLPADNETYLSEFDNSSLIVWIDKLYMAGEV